MWGNYSAGRRGMPQGPAGFGMNNGGAWAGAGTQNMGIGGMNPWMMGMGGAASTSGIFADPSSGPSYMNMMSDSNNPNSLSQTGMGQIRQNALRLNQIAYGNPVAQQYYNQIAQSQNPMQFMGGGANRNMQVPAGFGGYQNPMAMYQLPNMGQGPMSRPQGSPWMIPGYSMQGKPGSSGSIMAQTRGPDGRMYSDGSLSRLVDPNDPYFISQPKYDSNRYTLPVNDIGRLQPGTENVLDSGATGSSWPTQMIQNNPFMSRLPQIGGNSMMGSGSMQGMGLNPQILQMLMGMYGGGSGMGMNNPMIPRASWGYK